MEEQTRIKEHVVFRSYKVAKAYSSEAYEASEAVTLEGTAFDALVLGQLLNEKVKLQVLLDARNTGVLATEDVGIYVEGSVEVLERVEGLLEHGLISETAEGIILDNREIVVMLVELHREAN